MRQTLVRTLLLCAVVFCLGKPGLAQEREFKPRRLIPSDRFKPITKFPILKAADAEIGDNELVLGVVVEGQARAYPINMLTGPSREILNDELGGVAIAATW